MFSEAVVDDACARAGAACADDEAGSAAFSACSAVAYEVWDPPVWDPPLLPAAYREGRKMTMRCGSAQFSTPAPLSNPNKNYTTLKRGTKKK